MTSMTMCMQFATSVRFGTGLAADGLDEVLDHEQPISSAAIKGVFRDEARWLLPGTDDRDHPFVMSVFGGPQGEQCPWNFQVTQPSTVRYQSRASIRLGADGVVCPGALHIKQEATMGPATLEITQRSALPDCGFRLYPGTRLVDYHMALIHLAGRAVEKVGQRRTRGMGWVSISCPARSVWDDLALIWQLREVVQ